MTMETIIQKGLQCLRDKLGIRSPSKELIQSMGDCEVTDVFQRIARFQAPYITAEKLNADLVLIQSRHVAVTCGVCRFRDKQEPRLCNHSLGIDVAINPWDSCEHGEREVET